MTAPTGDRRVRRSRAALQRAMVELVNEQGYEAISVDGLASRADVTRATFYAHYPSKAELLTAVVDSFADEVMAAMAADAPVPGPGRLEILLERARASGDVLRIIVRGEGDGEPLRRFSQRVEQVLAADLQGWLDTAGRTRPEHFDLMVKLRAAQIVAAVAWFLDHGHGYEPAEIAAVVASAVDQGWPHGRGPDASAN